VSYGYLPQLEQRLQTVDAIPAALGRPPAAALDHGYFSPTNIQGLESRGIDPYIATGREPHQRNWQEFCAASPAPPAADARPIVKMAYKLRTDIGKAIYRLRKCTVEPVIGSNYSAGGYTEPHRAFHREAQRCSQYYSVPLCVFSVLSVSKPGQPE